MKSIGERIKALRDSLDLRQKDLADKAGITEATLSRYENNLREPKGEIVSKLAKALNVSTDYLLGSTDNPNAKIYTGDLNGDKVEIEVNKDYPHELTPDEVKELIDNLNEVGFDVDKLIEKVKNKENKKD